MADKNNIDVTDAATVEKIAGANNETSPSEKDKVEPEKKYTDDDVDKIVAKKIMRERDRMQKLFNEEQQLSDIEIRERDVLARELRADARDLLDERKLPSLLADILNYESKEKMIESLGIIEKCFREALQASLENAFRGKTPRMITHDMGNEEKSLRSAFGVR